MLLRDLESEKDKSLAWREFAGIIYPDSLAIADTLEAFAAWREAAKYAKRDELLGKYFIMTRR